ncbi:MAG: mechanosensitive ion channel family protein [Spirochaetota bacterium]|nr:mechanosensitive ion channel family protein [Spirochaetota bacterium]
MIYFRIIIFISLLLGNLSFTFAVDTNAINTTQEQDSNNDKIIVILPFYNYSDSDLKYISTYIPELISGHISDYIGFKVLDSRLLDREIKRRGMTPEMLYDKHVALRFFEDINADIGLYGRYIIHGTSMRIEYKVAVFGVENVDRDYAFDGEMNEYLLNTLDKFSQSSTDWLVKNVLSKYSLNLEKREKTRSKKYLDRIKESMIGRFIRNKWIFAILMIFFFYFLSKLTSLLIKRFFPRIIELANGSIDESIIRKFRRTLKWIIILIGIRLSLILLDISPNIYSTLNAIIVAFIIALVIYEIILVIEGLALFMGKDVADKINPRVNRDLMPLFVSLIKISVVIIGTIIILSKFDIDVGPFIASIGIMGIAVGFAVRDSLADFIGGIFLALDHSIAAGDMVTIDDDTGIIQEVGLRNTKLLTFDNEMIIIPNGDLSNTKFKNFVLPDPAFRIVVNFSVAYGADVDRVEEVVLNALKGIEDLSDDPAPQCLFIEMGDFSLNFQAKFWIPDYNNKLFKKMEATKAIYKALNESNIAIPFPTQTLYIKNDQE